MQPGGKILILDDEADLADALGEYLGMMGHAVRLAASTAEADRLLAAEPADLIVLDVNMPQESGLAFLRRLRRTSQMPVLVLSAVAGTAERVVALEMGADDVAQKPIDPRELAARVAALLARHHGHARRLVMVGEASVDLDAARVLHMDGQTEALTPGEIALLRALITHRGQVLAREALIEAAPALDLDADARAIDRRIARLRGKLRGEAIRAAPGGYLLE